MSIFVNRFCKLLFVSSLKSEHIFQAGYIFIAGSYYDIREFGDVVEVYVLQGIFLREV